MQYCIKCGAPLFSEARFCNVCGAVVIKETSEAPQNDDLASQSSLELDPFYISPLPDATAPTQSHISTVPESLAPQTAPTSFQDSSITPQTNLIQYHKSGIGEKLFTLLIVIIMAGLGSTILTSIVGFSSTFMGDPFHLRPTLQKWGLHLWGGAEKAPSPFMPNLATEVTPPVSNVQPAVAITPAEPVLPIHKGSMSLTISVTGTGSNDPARSKGHIGAAVKPRLNEIIDTWNRILAQKSDYPNCDMVLKVKVDSRGQITRIQLTTNRNVPKTLTDAAMKAVEKTIFGKGGEVILEMRFKFFS